MYELRDVLKHLCCRSLDYNNIREKAVKRDILIKRFIQEKGSLISHPNEEHHYEKIRKQYRMAMEIQNEKCAMAFNMHNKVNVTILFCNQPRLTQMFT